VIDAHRKRRASRALFVAERYVPGGDPELVSADASRAREASDRLDGEADGARYLGSTLFPADELCFALFEARSAAAVARLIELASIPYEHVVEAVLIGADVT
jgi:hypothetical protein